MSHISKDLLREYVAGRLSVEARQVIEDSAVWNAELRERIAALRAQPTVDRGCSTELPENDDDPVEPPPVYARRTGASWAMVSAGLLFILCFAVLPGAFGIQFIVPDAARNAAFGLRAGLIDPASILHQVLEQGANNERSLMAGAMGFVKPVAVFKHFRGAFCREFEIAYFDGPRFAGVACRTQEGAWGIEVLAAHGSAEASANGAFRPASDRAAELIAIVVERVKSQPSLDDEQVHELIKRKWTGSD